MRFLGHVMRFVSQVMRFLGHMMRFIGHMMRFVGHDVMNSLPFYRIIYIYTGIYLHASF